MGIFNTFPYSDGTDPTIPQTLYGDFSKLEFSVAPFTSKAIDNETFGTVVRPRVDLSWTNPSGDIFGFRLVRNQEGWSETEEDGQIILESFDPTTPALSTFTDQLDEIALIPGKYSYYSIWLLLADNSWYCSDKTYVLIPKSHNVVSPEGVELQSSEYKFASLIPRVFISEQQSATDEIDQTSELYRFLSGMAYTLDEILTFADLLAPSLAGKNNNPNFVLPLAKQLGIPTLPTASLKTQKRLIREAIYIQKQKGTENGISTFTEALTGFSPTVSVSPNLLLSLQESTFYNGVGNWKNVSSNLTLTPTIEAGTPTGEDYAVDSSWSGKYHTISTGGTSWLLGYDNPVLEGIPVSAETEYRFSLYAKGTGTGTTGLRVFFFNLNGEQITNHEPTYAAINSTWTEYTYNYTTPAGTAYLGLQIALNSPQNNKDYYWDMVQVAATSDVRSSEFHEARAVEIYLAPSKVNWVDNPSFADGVDNPLLDLGWEYTSNITPTYVSPTTVPGIKDNSEMLEITTPVSETWSAITNTSILPSGKFYTFSIYAKADGAEDISLDIQAWDAATSEVIVTPTSQPVQNTEAYSLTADWARYTVDLYIPSTSIDVKLAISVSGDGNGNVISLDDAQAEEAYKATDFFDGDYGARGAYWVGTENISKSIIYPNKFSKLGTLETELAKYLPLNTAFVITSGFETLTTVEVKGISS